MAVDAERFEGTHLGSGDSYILHNEQEEQTSVQEINLIKEAKTCPSSYRMSKCGKQK